MNPQIVSSLENAQDELWEGAVFPPNKPMEAVFDFSNEAKVYDHLLFMDFNSKGECLLSSSNITGNFWEGHLLLFPNQEALLNLKHSSFYVYATQSDGKFLDDNTIVVAEDTGVISVILKENLQPINYFKHLDRIPQISVWKNSNNVLACSGNSVTISDINSIEHKPTTIYSDYHMDTVTSIDALQSDPKLFVSSSRDRKCCLWDLRIEQPASVLYNNGFTALNAVAWDQDGKSRVVVGTQAGDLYLVDVRQPRDFIDVNRCFDTSLHRINYEEGKLAVCGDKEEVKVFKIKDNFQLVYDNVDHKNIVRDVKWFKGDLYSCGFDKSVKVHKNIFQ